ncbi:MOSC domain-containing protein [Gelatiniphilus marinus]|uniref:MOSC domain-containing protein n=1 Tax=Gelatiniphilus marinus TaxID=1759464 RepID=A0ABW5JSZ3_9FLAO
MKITSTNIAKPTTIVWSGKKFQTGIYKTPTNTPIYLEKEAVKGDVISDRKVHGGIYKACYLFSKNHYGYWKKLYTNLSWNYGMFGENLTVTDLDENKLFIGDIFKIGDALVQITQPREPCFKFGVKFGTQHVLKQFINHGFPGTYVRVLKEGFVTNGDKFKLEQQAKNSLTTAQLFKLIHAKEKNETLLKLAIINEALPQSKREKLALFVN